MVLMLRKGASKKEMDAINRQLASTPPRKKLDAKKYCGVIKLKKGPLAIEMRLRDEW